jgi:uncharacterized membrane protein HdeD (DUF308 family)
MRRNKLRNSSLGLMPPVCAQQLDDWRETAIYPLNRRTSMSTTQDLSKMQDAFKDALHAHWKLFLFQGVAMIILGGLAVAEPFLATVAVDIYVGWLFLISGIVGLVAMFSARDVPAFLWTLLTAALSLVVGVMLIWKPGEGAMSLTIVLTALFIAEGIFQIVASFTYRDVVPGSWGWMLVSGISDLILVAIIIYYWPISASWTLGLLVGVNLLTTGIAVVVTAVEARNFAQSLARAVT